MEILQLWFRQRGGLEIIGIGSLTTMKKSSGVFESFQCLFSVETKSGSLLTLEIIAAVFTYYCQLVKKKEEK